MTSTSHVEGVVARRPALWWMPVVGAGITIGLQILWPLAEDGARTTLTIVTVITFALTSVAHAWIYLGWQWALGYLAMTTGFAFAIEAIGTGTGFPFSAYEYTDALGLRFLEVPLVIPIAWAMTAYPVLLLSRRLTSALNLPHGRRFVCAAIGAAAMTAWDLFLDPQMVSAGYWKWAHQSPHLPGIPDIPAANYAGWLAASFVLMMLLSLLPWRAVPEGVPATLWTWTWVGGMISNAFFFGRPTVALVGGIAMALVTVPYLWLLISRHVSNADTNSAQATVPVS